MEYALSLVELLLADMEGTHLEAAALSLVELLPADMEGTHMAAAWAQARQSDPN